jgi:muramoyltetrapeptide carboxypeptidase
MTFPLPRPVRPGSRLGIIAPAGPFDEEAFCAGLGWLAERYEPVHRPDIFARTGYLAGDDARRLAELWETLADPSIDAIVCARGGFGTTRILPGLDPEEVRRANKLVVGFSDITALHAVWGAAGVRSVHAPMVAALGSASPAIRGQWIDTVENPGNERSWELCPLRETAFPARGLLTGGNLAVLAALLGTPRAPSPAGRILFIEDVGERPYRIDRVLTTMKQAGFFDGLAGLVVGAFTEGDPGPDGVSVEQVIAEHFGEAPFPVLVGFPAGHIAENEPIPFGSPASIAGGVLTVNPPSSLPRDLT